MWKSRVQWGGTGSDSDESESDDEGGEGFERIKSRMERKKDKLLSMDPKDVTYEMVAKKLREVISLRGKKGIDRQEQVRHVTC
jgi:translation initiation factor 3 subunit C